MVTLFPITYLSFLAHRKDGSVVILLALLEK
jgi:hypothetical protein